MGLNYVRRGRREDLDPPNDFITVALSRDDPDFVIHDEQLILDFENRVLDRVQKRLENLNFDE